MDWRECLNKKIAKKVQEDVDLIKSLVKTSDNKLESEGKLEMSDITATSKLSLAYDSLREILEALALKKGYKIYNHECYTALLKEALNLTEKGDEFDEIRKVRNSVNYYGKEISTEEVENVLKRIKILRKAILDLLEE